MPSSANISMNKNNRNSNDMIDLMELSNDITRFLNEDQYLLFSETTSSRVNVRMYMCVIAD